jgi:hypothetical protein
MTLLNYDITSDKSPLYTTVDQLNQSSTNLTFTATNSGKVPVTIKAIEIELRNVVNGADTVQLLLPGSEGGIGFPNSVTGPAGSAWGVTANDGQFTLKPQNSVTFQPGDKVTLVLTKVVIREGGNGTAMVPVFEGSDAGKGQTMVGIGITQSTLDVKLSADQILIGPGQTVTLKWTTQDATSGVLTLPGSSPDTLTLDVTNLSSGQQTVSPIGNTIYSLTCQGRGPEVMSQVTISIKEAEASFFGSANAFGANDTITLSWQTSDATSCAISNDVNGASYSVPPSNGKLSSCVVSATPDGQTLILTMADGSNQELGRIPLPTPCPQHVTFTFTAEGTQTSVMKILIITLLKSQLTVFHADILAVGTPDGHLQKFLLDVNWEIINAVPNTVTVECALEGGAVGFGNFLISNSSKGTWQSNGGDASNGFYRPPVTITCTGFGGVYHLS